MSAAACLLSLGGTAAYAASDPALVDPQQQSTGDATLDDIIVTGEKTDRSLQQTTASVDVATSRQIETESLQSLQELFTRTANVTETYGSYGFTIRGISNENVSGGGSANLATVYVDGAPVPATILSAGIADLWDARQVEIFRGPQSTLQGLNALAGAIVVRTQDPTMDWNARARVMISDADETVFSFAGGGPLVRDELAFRIAVEKRDDAGFIRNVTRNTDEDPRETLNLRGKLLWTPSAAPQFRAQLTYNHFENDGGYVFSYARTDAPDFYDNRIATDNSPNRSAVEGDMASLELTYDLSDRLTLTSATAFATSSQTQSYDGDGGPENLSFGTTNFDFDTWTQELRLNYAGDRVRGLVGAFFYDRQQRTTSASRTNVPTPTGTIAALLRGNGLPAATANAIAALYFAALPVIPVDFSSDGESPVRTHALFGDGEWTITDRLSLVGGFRWDHEENEIGVKQVSVFAGTYPDPAAFGTALAPAIAGINAGVAGLVAQAGGTTLPESRGFDAYLPKLGLRYALTPDATASFVIQRGYRSGGSASNIARSALFAYEPEYTWNYEGSVRSQFLDRALTLNANVYYIDWTDQQVSVNFGLNNYDFHTVNAGKSHLYGFEIDASHRFSSAFDVYGSVGYSKTKFDEFIASVAGSDSDYAGSEFAFAPRWTLAAGANYRWSQGFVANLNAGYRTKVFTQVGVDQAATEVGDRLLVGGRVGYETDRWGAYVYAKNLLDEEYMTFTFAGSNRAMLGDPRVVGLSLEARW